MMLARVGYHPRVKRIAQVSHDIIPPFVEYAYYGLIFISVMPFGRTLSGPMIGSGMYLVLAAYCLMRLGLRAVRPIAIPLICGASFIALQILVHDESLRAFNVKPFIIWILQLIIVQSLFLRPEFLHRFVYIELIFGLILLR